MARSAVAGAHLTGTRDTSRPSVFEILSHEGFASALKPAVFHIIKVNILCVIDTIISCDHLNCFRHLSVVILTHLVSFLLYLQIFAEKNPAGKFAVVYRYFDELYLGFDAIIQWHYILTRGRRNVVI